MSINLLILGVVGTSISKKFKERMKEKKHKYHDLGRLNELVKEVDSIVKSELKKEGISYGVVETEVYDIKTVGVQGDSRSYNYPVQISIRHKNGKVYWNPEFINKLSTSITNNVTDVNRVVYLLKDKKYSFS